VTHNLLEARDLSDSVVLLADGTVVEQTDTKTFFEQSPATELGRRFRESGNCWTASSLLDEESDSCGADGNAQKPEQLPSWRPTAAEATPQPGGFHWVLRGLLGGMQMPGLLRETDSDLRGAAALGVQHLVSLTELAFSSEAAGRFGISVRHFPIEDMGVPTITGAYELTGWVQEVLARREPVALHCRAGLGRTGTMLACVLVRGGMRGLSAIETVRKVNPLYIQSEVQFAFVNAFGEFCAKSALSA
jgi:atypical dual specificity phosphatase